MKVGCVEEHESALRLIMDMAEGRTVFSPPVRREFMRGLKCAGNVARGALEQTGHVFPDPPKKLELRMPDEGVERFSADVGLGLAAGTFQEKVQQGVWKRKCVKVLTEIQQSLLELLDSASGLPALPMRPKPTTNRVSGMGEMKGDSEMGGPQEAPPDRELTLKERVDDMERRLQNVELRVEQVAKTEEVLRRRIQGVELQVEGPQEDTAVDVPGKPLGGHGAAG